MCVFILLVLFFFFLFAHFYEKSEHRDKSPNCYEGKQIMKYLYLKQKNLHERDSQLFFDEDLHQYNYNDKVLTSVTTVISEFFPFSMQIM